MRYLLAAALCMLSVVSWAQMWSRVQQNPDKYFIGTGTAATEQEADQLALAELISQISVSVTVDTDIKDYSEQSGGKIVSDNTIFKSTISTYSNATLTSTERMVLSDPGDKVQKVARWISRAEFGKILESRRNKIHGFIDAAMRALEKGKIDVALKSYYWAYALLQTMQYVNNEKYYDHVLVTWLPEQITDILGDLHASVVANDGNGNIDINILYKDKPVSSIDYTYNDGGMWSTLCSAKDGLGRLEITSTLPMRTYDIQIEVEYRDQADLDREVNSIMQYIPEFVVKQGFIQIPCLITPGADIAKTKENPGSKPIVDFAKNTAAQTFTSVPVEELAAPPTVTAQKAEEYTAILRRVEKAIKTNASASVADCFTSEGYDLFRRLIGYGKGRIIGTPRYVYSAYKGYTWARGMSMSFSFRHGVRRNFTEDIVFTFDETGLIRNVAFGLGATTTADILADNAVPAAARMLLTDFMENYQTAFALKRLDYIQSIFSENALIIVVNKLVNAGREGAYHSKYQSIRLDREAYIDRLERQFREKEFINLRFNQTDLRRSSDNVNTTVYGIQLEQDYYSSNYCDHGYLFLQINLSEPEKPLIQVRTWQPEPDPEFGVYSNDDFPIQHTD